MNIRLFPDSEAEHGALWLFLDRHPVFFVLLKFTRVFASTGSRYQSYPVDAENRVH